jgi:hypothetical protein
MIKVIMVTHWHYGQANSGLLSGLSSQVTLCSWKGLVFCVRENTNGVDSFLVGSGERWGDKIGKRPGKARQLLELYAPAGYWDVIKDLVQQADPLNRPVKNNKLFNKKWVIDLFKKNPGYLPELVPAN